MKNSSGFPIDAVITWVDGNDPAHKAKRVRYARPEQLSNEDIGGDTRYANIGEINYCVASLLRFAPWLRKIFIVTDGQDPALGPFIGRYFPESRTEIEIIDHKVLYSGYENFLPVFNSLSIETVLWRIPELSEHFIYLNDDFLLVAPTAPEDFFENGKPICYASYFSVGFARFLRTVKPRRHGQIRFGFKDSLLNAAEILGIKDRLLLFGHAGFGLRRSPFRKFYETHPGIMEKNMQPRFREPFQYNPQELFYLLESAEGECIVKPREGRDIYVKPRKGYRYMARKLRSFDRAGNAVFCCFNSLEDASEEDIRLAVNWIRKRLGIEA